MLTCKYDTHIKPRFDEIKKWLEIGVSEGDVAKNLGVSSKYFYNCKHKYPEFAELIKNSRKIVVVELKNALYKKAKGFTYKEVKEVEQAIEYNDGGEIVPAKLIRTETTFKYAPPDTGAALLLLKHWDRDEEGHSLWSSDPQTIELKKEELELKKKALSDTQDWEGIKI